MVNYSELREFCENEKEFSASILNEFMQPYGAGQDKLVQEFYQKMERFKMMDVEMKEDMEGMLLGMFVCHRIFGTDGLIHKYLKHSALKQLPSEEYEYLQTTSQTPWQYSFSLIIENPAPDFHLMKDVFTDREFLVYSPAITRRAADADVMLWFGQYRFNTKCWMTVGNITGFYSFDQDDIFYFATELNSKIEDDEDLVKDLDKNSFPYLLLALGGSYGRVFSEQYELVISYGEYDVPPPDFEKLRRNFVIQEKEGLMKLTLKTATSRNFAVEAYYNLKEENIFVYATSRERYHELVTTLIKAGIDIPDEADVYVHGQMWTFLEKLLNRHIILNPYEDEFEPLESKTPELTQQVNELLSIAMHQVNAHEELDVAELAASVGMDYHVAKGYILQAFANVPHLRIKPHTDNSLN